MRTRWVLAAGISLAGALAGAAGLGLAKTPVRETAPANGPQLKASKFVVHEWGTFTSFSGSDGVRMEFRPLVDDELPGFVLDRIRFSVNPFGKFDLSALERMETPVTYFYVDRPRDVKVQVAFPQGLLTEFYPPVQKLLPPVRADKRPPLENSLLDWGRVRLWPQAEFEKRRQGADNGHSQAAAPPQVEGDNHYAFARETDSAMVEATDRFNRKHYEKFLFYRGLGDFSLPLTFSAPEQGRYEINNDGPEAVHDLFVVHIDADRVRYRRLPQVHARSSLSVEAPQIDSTLAELCEEMVQALAGTGLYEKEARAMVKTWRSSWFGEPGVRLLYLVPERITHELLPLTVRPEPDELVRVLVGRMELFAPEESERLLKLVRESGSCLAIEAEPLHGELTRLGRFAEPALRYLAGRARDEGERAAILQLAAALGPTMRGRLPATIEPSAAVGATQP